MSGFSFSGRRAGKTHAAEQGFKSMADLKPEKVIVVTVCHAYPTGWGKPIERMGIMMMSTTYYKIYTGHTYTGPPLALIGKKVYPVEEAILID